jgi:hypothetical protein
LGFFANIFRKFSISCKVLSLLALQGFKQVVLKHHERFTDKTLNHIVYIDKELWGSPNGALKQKILSDAKNNKTLKIGYTKIGIFCKYFSQIFNIL